MLVIAGTLLNAGGITRSGWLLLGGIVAIVMLPILPAVANVASRAAVWVLRYAFGSNMRVGRDAADVLSRGRPSSNTYPTCGHCGYFLRGLRSNCCPECGTLFSDNVKVERHDDP